VVVSANKGIGINEGGGVSKGIGINEGGGVSKGIGINEGGGVNHGIDMNEGGGVNKGIEIGKSSGVTHVALGIENVLLEQILGNDVRVRIDNCICLVRRFLVRVAATVVTDNKLRAGRTWRVGERVRTMSGGEWLRQ